MDVALWDCVFPEAPHHVYKRAARAVLFLTLAYARKP
jgi:hypothetical protein